MGMSSPIDCRDPFDRQEMLDQAQFESGDDPVANLGAITMTATTSCTDTIAPGDSAYDNAHAAEDIERLRSTWDVPALALLGIGNGAQVALAYAGSHPDKVARLVLDSPVAARHQRRGRRRATGQGPAGRARRVRRAVRRPSNCPLGPDPKGAVDSLLAAARAGNGARRRVGGRRSPTPSSPLWASPAATASAATNSLANTLAAARSGDANQLNNLINQAEAMRDTDGQFVNSCSDALNRPTPDRVRELVVAWGKLYPQFGTVGGARPRQVPELAERLGRRKIRRTSRSTRCCSACRTTRSSATRACAATAATIINAGAASKRVIWQGIGHGASVYSACALPPMIGYLDSGNLPADRHVLPRLSF